MPYGLDVDLDYSFFQSNNSSHTDTSAPVWANLDRANVAFTYSYTPKSNYYKANSLTRALRSIPTPRDFAPRSALNHVTHHTQTLIFPGGTTADVKIRQTTPTVTFSQRLCDTKASVSYGASAYAPEWAP